MPSVASKIGTTVLGECDESAPMFHRHSYKSILPSDKNAWARHVSREIFSSIEMSLAKTILLLIP